MAFTSFKFVTCITIYWKSYAQSLLDNVGFGGKKEFYSEYYFPNLIFVFGEVLDGVEFI